MKLEDCDFKLLSQGGFPYSWVGCAQHGGAHIWTVDNHYCEAAAELLFPRRFQEAKESAERAAALRAHVDNIERLRRDIVRVNNRLRALDAEATPEQRQVLAEMRQAGINLSCWWSEL